ncbi:type IV toxin-antitoxin system AbiEi family antitoxin domain-containing protein [Amnibacterium endophyticum]|uniref:Uncharacterized protein n=1 Tax=Amnibacterium endophyticum TaxID=2109337 RepID=A0ABW4LGA8_9MICO
MQLAPLPPDPWRIDVVVVRNGSHTSTERSALRRGVEAGELLRIGHGLLVDAADFTSLDPEAQHVVRMRAIAAGSSRPVVFSHASAAVVHGLPVLRQRLRTVHTTVARLGDRSTAGVTGHVFALLEQEVVEVHGLLVTTPARTVVDVAGSRPFEEGVITADGALRAGLLRSELRSAADLAGPRQAATRILDVIAFAHPGAESAAESRFRTTAMRLGLEVPVLQYRVVRADGSEAFIDGVFPIARAAVEVDGDRKYLDPALAPDGAAAALLLEKRRQDEVQSHFARLVRIGWVQSGSAALLGPVLARVGVLPQRPRPGLAAYAAAAALAGPRLHLGRPLLRS